PERAGGEAPGASGRGVVSPGWSGSGSGRGVSSGREGVVVSGTSFGTGTTWAMPASGASGRLPSSVIAGRLLAWLRLAGSPWGWGRKEPRPTRTSAAAAAAQPVQAG